MYSIARFGVRVLCLGSISSKFDHAMNDVRDVQNFQVRFDQTLIYVHINNKYILSRAVNFAKIVMQSPFTI